MSALPQAQQTRVFELDASDAIIAMNRWYAEAMPITASAWVAASCISGWLAPSQRCTLRSRDSAVNRCRKMPTGGAPGGEQEHPFFSGADATAAASRVLQVDGNVR